MIFLDHDRENFGYNRSPFHHNVASVLSVSFQVCDKSHPKHFCNNIEYQNRMGTRILVIKIEKKELFIVNQRILKMV